MYVYGKVWSNKFNRTLLFSSLMTFWALFIELFFLFWPRDTLENEFLINILFFDLFGVEIFGWIFHTIIWSVFFFFLWMTYSLIKELSRSRPANISEFIITVLIIALFVSFINNIQIATLFLLFTAGEFFYMYLSLKD
jgi:hypothetical protein